MLPVATFFSTATATYSHLLPLHSLAAMRRGADQCSFWGPKAVCAWWQFRRLSRGWGAHWCTPQLGYCTDSLILVTVTGRVDQSPGLVRFSSHFQSQTFAPFLEGQGWAGCAAGTCVEARRTMMRKGTVGPGAAMEVDMEPLEHNRIVCSLWFQEA